MQTNSGASACGISAAGVRKDGVETVVDILTRTPNIDGFTIAWLHAGGRIEHGKLVGSVQLGVDLFAQVLSMQKRVKDAEMQGKIEPSEVNVVQRLRDGKPIKATAYRVTGSAKFVPRAMVQPVSREHKADPSQVATTMAELQALLN